MIKLTYNGTKEPVYVNTDSIRSFTPHEGGTIIRYIYQATAEVSESPDEVYRLITEYKQRQMRLQAAYSSFYSGIVDRELIYSTMKNFESEDRGE